jgi:hypothetical protein
MDAVDPVSRVLAIRSAAPKANTYASLSAAHNVPVATLWRRRHGRPSKKEQAAKQQYLSRQEGKALLDYVLRMSANGYPRPV